MRLGERAAGAMVGGIIRHVYHLPVGRSRDSRVPLQCETEKWHVKAVGDTHECPECGVVWVCDKIVITDGEPLQASWRVKEPAQGWAGLTR